MSINRKKEEMSMSDKQIKAVLFDLDGTLLPQDQDTYIKTYFGALVKKLAPYGYDGKSLVDSIWVGMRAMLANDGTKTNEQIFWDAFVEVCGEKVLEHYPVFEEFYRCDFDREVHPSCGYNPEAKRAVDYIKSKNLRVALATNPVFPTAATECRIAWAGLSPSDFELYTTYENSHYTKPVLNYYLEICEKLALSPEECLMVGNDVGDDMVAGRLGMKLFLLTDNLINKLDADISEYPNGTFPDLIEYIDTLS